MPEVPESFRGCLPAYAARAPATYALAAQSLAAWCAVAWRFNLSPLAAQDSALLLRAGAANGELLRAGDWWRLVTSQFLHVHFPHLVFNAVSILLLGRMLEREAGRQRLLAVYLVGGTIGQAVGVAATPALVASGASQALMSLAGAAASRSLRRPRLRGASMAILLAVVAVQIFLDVWSAGHVKAGHLAGFCAGALIGRVVWRSQARV